MRQQVRADYEAALTRIGGDKPFRTRFERFFAELRDPLFALYADDPGFPERLDAIAAAAARSPEPRALGHERVIDDRWMHRPFMDWEAASRGHDGATVEGRLSAGLRRLIDARRATRPVHAQGRVEPFRTGDDHVFGLCREHAGERLPLLVDFSAGEHPVQRGAARLPGEGVAALGPYEYRWEPR
jgi:hypothetical protein